MRTFILLACLLVAVYAHSTQLESQEWQLFKAHHAKNYANGKEEKHRMKIFLENKAFVENHNKRFANGEVSYTVELNKFADMTNEEFVAQYNTYKPHLQKKTNGQKMLYNGAQIPSSFDWRKSGAVTPVKNQQQCGSCWAFSTTGSIEGQHQIKTGKLVSLSEQQLVDCSTENNGCGGGMIDTAFDYVIAFGGLQNEDTYPYKAEDNCKADKSKIAVSITSYVDIPCFDEKSLTTAIATAGPVSVTIDAGNPSFQLYKSGVYDEPNCSTTDLDHAVLAVGYGTLSGKDYYIVKNSWDTDWGQSGYIFMSRNGQNQCGIATLSSYPKV